MTRCAPPPLALYVHLPWCVRRCPYCDFNAHVSALPPEDDYVAALLADFDAESERIAGRLVRSVFLGGGTPSLFSPGAIERLLEGIHRRVRVAAHAEVTLEANPGTVERARFAAYRAAGVNRLSVGVQSFDDGALARLGRIHRARESHRALEAAREAGFAELNVDLMYGLPDQCIGAAVADVGHALSHAPTHVSHYELTIEPNTPFHHAPPVLPDDEHVWQMHRRCHERLEASGLRRYEVSAYALPGHQCRHNANYWRFGDYVGIGAGAHGKLSDATTGVIWRSVKHRHPRRYLEGRARRDFDRDRRPVATSDLPFEFMLNAARLPGGFPAELFRRRTGLPLECLEAPIAEAATRGLLWRRGTRIHPTERGMRFVNELVALFLDADDNGDAPPAPDAKRARLDRADGPVVL